MYVSILKFEAQNGLNDPNQMTHIAVKSKHRLNVTEMIAHVKFHYRDHTTHRGLERRLSS
jgi:hypothetical protein